MSSDELLEGMRFRSGLNQTALAKRAGVQQPVISMWESGGRSPSLRSLSSLAAAAGHEVALVPTSVARRSQLPSAFLRDIEHHRVAEHFRCDPERVVQLARVNLVGMRKAHTEPAKVAWLDLWEQLLDQPGQLLLYLLHPSTELEGFYSVSPFMGVIPKEERKAMLSRLR